jgi:hypothetical protein
MGVYLIGDFWPGAVFPVAAPIKYLFYFQLDDFFHRVLNLGRACGDPLAFFFCGTLLRVPNPKEGSAAWRGPKWQRQVKSIRRIASYRTSNLKNCCKGLGYSCRARVRGRSRLLIRVNRHPSHLHGRRISPVVFARLDPASLGEPAQRTARAGLGVSGPDPVVGRGIRWHFRHWLRLRPRYVALVVVIACAVA